MRTKRNNLFKAALRQGVALLLAMALCTPLMSVFSSVAAPIAGEDNTIFIWEWTRVDSQADLPTDTPKDHNGNAYDYQVMLLFDSNGYQYEKGGWTWPKNEQYPKQYMVDGGDRNGSQDDFWLRGKALPQGVLYGTKTFRTLEPISNMWMRYSGTNDTSNGNAKQYYLYASSAPGGLSAPPKAGSGFIEAGKRRYNFDGTNIDGVEPVYYELEWPLDKWTIYTPESGDYAPAQGRVKSFVNVPKDIDTIMIAGDGQLKRLKASSWDIITQFVMYVGRKQTWSAVTHDITVQSEQVQNIDGYVYVEPGVTITVEPGGVLSIQGTLYNNGYIYNQGDILLQKGACIETFRLENGEGGALCCDGGDLILLNDARIAPGWCIYDETYGNGFVLRNGATCTNFGTVLLQNNAYIESGATLDNRESGTVLFGYRINWQNDGNLHTYPSSEIYNSNIINPTFDSSGISYIMHTMYWGEDTLLYNQGKLDLYGWAQATSDKVEYAGDGRIEIPYVVRSYIGQIPGFSQTYPASWRPHTSGG